MSEHVQFEKGAILQEAGQGRICIYKVESGLLRSFFTDKNGKEHTLVFATAGWIISDIEAIAFEQSSELTIEALELSSVEIIQVSQLSASKDGEFASEFFRMMKRAGKLQRRVLMLMSTSAIERYEHFLEVYPDLSPRLTQRLISSYLGITPQALSKLRAGRVGINWK